MARKHAGIAAAVDAAERELELAQDQYRRVSVHGRNTQIAQRAEAILERAEVKVSEMYRFQELAQELSLVNA